MPDLPGGAPPSAPLGMGMPPQNRLRDAFAQLLAQNGQSVPLDKMMQMQALQQGLKQPPPTNPNLAGSGLDFSGQSRTPMPQVQPAPNLNFPVAPANPNGMLGGKGVKEAPFHGKGEVVQKKAKEAPKRG